MTLLTVFSQGGWIMWPLLACSLLSLAIIVVDVAASALGAKRFGATRWGIAGAAIGLLVGLFAGPIGLVVGPLVGAILGEVIMGRTGAEAARAGFGAFLGLVGGTLAKFVLCAALVLAALVAHVA